jgi:hypothetical protein
MKIKEQAIRDMDLLATADLLVVYDMIQSLKGKGGGKSGMATAYTKVQEALKGCKGDMSDDILRLRADRA